MNKTPAFINGTNAMYSSMRKIVLFLLMGFYTIPLLLAFFDGSGHPSNRAGATFLALYWHQRGRNAGNAALDSLTLNAVYKGYFRPDCWASKLESYTSSELAQVNQNRKQYLLEPLEDYYKKAAFQQRKLKDPHNPYFRFYNMFMFIVQ